MKCNNCGTEHEAKFCPNCGAPTEQAPPTYNQQPNYGQQANYQGNNYSGVQSSIKQSSMGITALILCATGCLGIVGLILAIIDLTKKDATKKHTCSKIAIGIFAAYFILGIALGLSKKDTTTDSVSNSVDATTAVLEEVVSTENSTEELKEKYSPGDTWKNDFVNVNYLECGEYTDYEQYSAPKDGNKIIYAKFEFENVGKSDQVAMYTDFKCYADGYACDGYYGVDGSGIDFCETLSSGRKCDGVVAFEVPKDAKEIEIEYDTNVWTSENIVFEYTE